MIVTDIFLLPRSFLSEFAFHRDNPTLAGTAVAFMDVDVAAADSKVLPLLLFL